MSGGDAAAKNGTLSIMVGGDEGAFARALPTLQLVGKTIVYQGGPGSGQNAKACNQIVIAGTIMGVAEGLAYAMRNGLDPDKILEVITTGAAGSFILSNLGPKMLARDYAPGFYVEHFLKDLTIAAEQAERVGLDLVGLNVALRRYMELAATGRAFESTHVLYESYNPVTR